MRSSSNACMPSTSTCVSIAVRVAVDHCRPRLRLCKPIRIPPPIFPRRVDSFRQVRAFESMKLGTTSATARVGIAEGLHQTGDSYRGIRYVR